MILTAEGKKSGNTFMKQKILLGTRGSTLAMTQTEEVKKVLENKFPELSVDIKVIKTKGDQDLTSPLASFGGRGAFVQSIEKALLRNEIDAAVHSLKDLPSNLPRGLILAASPVREDPRDGIITRGGFKLMSLPEGSVIGTGSDRRRIQLKKVRPDLQFKNIRGNIETRIDKLNKESYDAIVLSAAAIKRLNKSSIVSEFLEINDFIPAPCQGALGVECRADDGETIGILKKIDNPAVRICVDAERTFISTLGMGCHMPVGALAVVNSGGIYFRAFAGSDEWGIMKKTIQSSKGNISNAVRQLAIKFKMNINRKNTQKGT